MERQGHFVFSLSVVVVTICLALVSFTQADQVQFTFGQNYPLNSTNILFSTELNVAIGMKFIGTGGTDTDTIGGTFMMQQYLNDEMKPYKQFPIVNVTTDGKELTLLGVYALNLTNAQYEPTDTFFLYMSYYMGVFNAPPNTMNLLLLDDSILGFVPIPNQKRETFVVKTLNATFNMYDNVLQNKVLYMGVFGEIVVQQSAMDVYVNISYPQIVNYNMDSDLNQTLNVYYYDWYGTLVGKPPNRYMMINVSTDQISYPSSSFISLYQFKIIGAPGQSQQQPYYNGYGLRNYVFNFNVDLLSNYYLEHSNETLKIDTLVCGYQEKGTKKYIDNGRSKVNVKSGTLSCDDTLGDRVESVTLMIQTNVQPPPPPPQPSASNSTTTPSVDHTIVIAATASAFGAVLLCGGIITIVAMICCFRRTKRYDIIE